jgi:hypothetical protein
MSSCPRAPNIYGQALRKKEEGSSRGAGRWMRCSEEVRRSAEEIARGGASAKPLVGDV